MCTDSNSNGINEHEHRHCITHLSFFFHLVKIDLLLILRIFDWDFEIALKNNGTENRRGSENETNRQENEHLNVLN